MTTTNITTNANKSTKIDATKRIKSLLNALAHCDDQKQKKSIRANLRRLGHYGASRTNDITFINKIDSIKHIEHLNDE